jgi:hypothetical protein
MLVPIGGFRWSGAKFAPGRSTSLGWGMGYLGLGRQLFRLQLHSRIMGQLCFCTPKRAHGVMDRARSILLSDGKQACAAFPGCRDECTEFQSRRHGDEFVRLNIPTWDTSQS